MARKFRVRCQPLHRNPNFGECDQVHCPILMTVNPDLVLLKNDSRLSNLWVWNPDCFTMSMSTLDFTSSAQVIDLSALAQKKDEEGVNGSAKPYGHGFTRKT